MSFLKKGARLVKKGWDFSVERSQQESKFAGADPGKWAVLAALRFVLAIFVVLHHLNHIGRELPVHFPMAEAVWGFLLISGYSIAASIEKNPFGFYARRAIRIYPAYLTGIAICVLLSIGATTMKGESVPFALFGAYLPYVLMMQSFVVTTPFWLGPAWTLSCEWLYYMVAPLLYRRDRLILILVAVSAASVLLHPGVVTATLWKEIYGIPALCMAWAWLAGYYIYRKGGGLLVGVACIALFQYSNGSPFGGAVFIVSLVVVSGNFALRGIAARVANYLGELSYVVYIIHVPVFLLAMHAFQSIRYTAVQPLLLLAAVTLVVYHGIDRPLRTALTGGLARFQDRRGANGRRLDAQPSQNPS